MEARRCTLLPDQRWEVPLECFLFAVLRTSRTWATLPKCAVLCCFSSLDAFRPGKQKPFIDNFFSLVFCSLGGVGALAEAGSGVAGGYDGTAGPQTAVRDPQKLRGQDELRLPRLCTHARCPRPRRALDVQNQTGMCLSNFVMKQWRPSTQVTKCKKAFQRKYALHNLTLWCVRRGSWYFTVLWLWALATCGDGSENLARTNFFGCHLHDCSAVTSCLFYMQGKSVVL